MRQQKLMRIEYATDIDPDDPEYRGSFSAPFPAEDDRRKIVSVDWSVPGEVSVTWLITA